MHGALINFISFYLAAIPISLVLGFLTPLGVFGLYSGIGVGPFLQCLLYGYLLLHIDWRHEALRASQRATAPGEEGTH
jgi:multidrug resistance protein, MATE family